MSVVGKFLHYHAACLTPAFRAALNVINVRFMEDPDIVLIPGYQCFVLVELFNL